MLFGSNNNFGIPYEVVLNVKPRHVVPDKYVYHSIHIHGWDEMVEQLGDLAKNFDDCLKDKDLVVMKKPRGQEIKELVTLRAIPTRTSMKKIVDNGYRSKYEEPVIPEEFEKYHVEMLEEQRILSPK